MVQVLFLTGIGPGAYISLIQYIYQRLIGRGDCFRLITAYTTDTRMPKWIYQSELYYMLSLTN